MKKLLIIITTLITTTIHAQPVTVRVYDDSESLIHAIIKEKEFSDTTAPSPDSIWVKAAIAVKHPSLCWFGESGCEMYPIVIWLEGYVCWVKRLNYDYSAVFYDHRKKNKLNAVAYVNYIGEDIPAMRLYD